MGLQRKESVARNSALRYELIRARTRTGPENIPRVRAKVSPSGKVLTVWCKYCKREHYHGNVEKRPPRHRTADCFGVDSPNRATGYYLVLDSAP